MARHCGLTGPRSRFVANGRSAGDRIFWGRWCCKCCFEDMLAVAFEPQIPFDDVLEGSQSGQSCHVSCLDYSLMLSFERVTAAPRV